MLSEQDIRIIIEDYKEPVRTIPRDAYVGKILDYLSRKEILILKGVRRSGKSTIMRQALSRMKRGVYVNLDDYRFFHHLSIELLERILDIYKGGGTLYLFLDEIQAVPRFESWLRTHYDKGTDVKFIISGSNSTLVSKDLGTLLTGRTITFEVAPLTYGEYKDFSTGSLQEYLEYGGFPEVVLEPDIEKKRELLSNYFDTITEKDMISKYNVQQGRQLKELLKFIISNPGVRVSANKLAKQLGISINTVKSYLALAEEVYLIFEVPFFSHSAKTKFVGSRVSKYYVIDNGFAKLFTTRFEKSKAYENAVATRFFKERDSLYYWKGDNEVDFVIDGKAINVTATKSIPRREHRGLEEIRKEFKHVKETLIVAETATRYSQALSEFLLAG